MTEAEVRDERMTPRAITGFEDGEQGHEPRVGTEGLQKLSMTPANSMQGNQNLLYVYSINHIKVGESKGEDPLGECNPRWRSRM